MDKKQQGIPQEIVKKAKERAKELDWTIMGEPILKEGIIFFCCIMNKQEDIQKNEGSPKAFITYKKGLLQHTPIYPYPEN